MQFKWNDINRIHPKLWMVIIFESNYNAVTSTYHYGISKADFLAKDMNTICIVKYPIW